MPSPQKTISTRNVAPESSDSEEEVAGLLERDFEGSTQLECMLIGELFEHFCSLGGLLQAVEETGGEALASSLSKNEKLMVKIGRFKAQRDTRQDATDGDGYGQS